jgi:hypothetical protein
MRLRESVGGSGMGNRDGVKVFNLSSGEVIGPVTMIQILPLPSLGAIEGMGLSDVRITLAGTIFR